MAMIPSKQASKSQQQNVTVVGDMGIPMIFVQENNPLTSPLH